MQNAKTLHRIYKAKRLRVTKVGRAITILGTIENFLQYQKEKKITIKLIVHQYYFLSKYYQKYSTLFIIYTHFAEMKKKVLQMCTQKKRLTKIIIKAMFEYSCVLLIYILM